VILGFVIENGELIRLVKGVVIAGNLRGHILLPV
jgi:predicted Zn-dependent protease